MIHLDTEVVPLMWMYLRLAVAKFARTRGINVRLMAQGHIGEHLMHFYYGDPAFKVRSCSRIQFHIQGTSEDQHFIEAQSSERAMMLRYDLR